MIYAIRKTCYFKQGEQKYRQSSPKELARYAGKTQREVDKIDEFNSPLLKSECSVLNPFIGTPRSISLAPFLSDIKAKSKISPIKYKFAPKENPTNMLKKRVGHKRNTFEIKARRYTNNLSSAYPKKTQKTTIVKEKTGVEMITQPTYHSAKPSLCVNKMKFSNTKRNSILFRGSSLFSNTILKLKGVGYSKNYPYVAL